MLHFSTLNEQTHFTTILVLEGKNTKVQKKCTVPIVISVAKVTSTIPATHVHDGGWRDGLIIPRELFAETVREEKLPEFFLSLDVMVKGN